MNWLIVVLLLAMVYAIFRLYVVEWLTDDLLILVETAVVVQEKARASRFAAHGPVERAALYVLGIWVWLITLAIAREARDACCNDKAGYYGDLIADLRGQGAGSWRCFYTIIRNVIAGAHGDLYWRRRWRDDVSNIADALPENKGESTAVDQGHNSFGVSAVIEIPAVVSDGAAVEQLISGGLKRAILVARWLFLIPSERYYVYRSRERWKLAAHDAAMHERRTIHIMHRRLRNIMRRNPRFVLTVVLCEYAALFIAIFVGSSLHERKERK